MVRFFLRIGGFRTTDLEAKTFYPSQFPLYRKVSIIERRFNRKDNTMFCCLKLHICYLALHPSCSDYLNDAQKQGLSNLYCKNKVAKDQGRRIVCSLETTLLGS